MGDDEGSMALLESVYDNARSPGAGQRLHALVKESRGDNAEQALFWLAQTDNDDSIAALTELLSR